MSVVVRIPPTLREATDGEREVLAEGHTVREVLDDLAEKFPALGARILDNGGVAKFVNVYVEGEDVRTRDGLETTVDDASTVILLPAMAGGSSRVTGRRRLPAGGAGLRRRLAPLAALQPARRA
jgi:molybdopterin converting factor small subunit